MLTKKFLSRFTIIAYVFFIYIFFSPFIFASSGLKIFKPTRLEIDVSSSEMKINDYISYFYNRYSKYFDVYGSRIKVPGYGKKDFTTPENSREIMSIASFYKYRAMQGDNVALEKIKTAIFASESELSLRPQYTQSFEDAIAQFLIIRLIDQVPNLLKESDKTRIYNHIYDRLINGIKAPDSSNRAAIAATYWQYIINDFYKKGIITSLPQKKQIDRLIKIKMNEVLKNDVNADGWYKEGDPKEFNPHYHLITAFSFLSYASMTGDTIFSDMARKMIENLRAISFRNGMIEASIGKRPVGLGAQFYLGAGLSNALLGYDDYSAYLYYAYGDRFFSDPAFPNRLEYHSTRENTAPEYHDDFAFSNIAELALVIPAIKKLTLEETKIIKDYPKIIKNSEYSIINYGDALWINNKKVILKTVDLTRVENLKVNLQETFLDSTLNKKTLLRALYDSDSDGIDDNEEQLRGTNPKNKDTDGDGKWDSEDFLYSLVPPVGFGPAYLKMAELRYSRPRFTDSRVEQHQSFILTQQIKKSLNIKSVGLNSDQWQGFVDAYLYGRYTVDEIIKSITNNNFIVHPDIPANEWRKSFKYRELYLQ